MIKLLWRLKFCYLAAKLAGYEPYHWQLSESLYTVRNGRVEPVREVVSKYLRERRDPMSAYSMSEYYQDAEGNIPVTKYGQKVGLVKHKMQSELLRATN